MSYPRNFAESCCANQIVRVSVPIGVHIYPGLPHGFRRWTKLDATVAFDADIVKSINALMNSPGVSQEWEDSWTIYSGKSQEEDRDGHQDQNIL